MINELKAKVFDILVEIEKRQVEIRKLDEMKMAVMQQLAKEQEKKSETENDG